jgi:hypothetical protein
MNVAVISNALIAAKKSLATYGDHPIIEKMIENALMECVEESDSYVDDMI